CWRAGIDAQEHISWAPTNQSCQKQKGANKSYNRGDGALNQRYWPFKRKGDKRQQNRSNGASHDAIGGPLVAFHGAPSILTQDKHSISASQARPKPHEKQAAPVGRLMSFGKRGLVGLVS